MSSVEAFRDGIRRVNQSPVILACVFVVTLLTALPYSVLLRDSIASHLGSSLAADGAAEAVNYQWLTEYQAQAGEIGRTLGTRVIGFAAVLDNLSAFLDRQRRSPAFLWLGTAYLLLWLFLAGGILDRYARNRPTRSYEFFTACGVYFVRFLRLAPVVAITYYALFAYAHPFLLGGVYESVTRDVTLERTAFFWRLGLYAVFGALLLLVNMIFDYAKVRAVVEDRRSMIGAIAAALRFVKRHFPAVAGLYLINGSLFVALVLTFALVAPGAGSAGPGLWLGLIVSQLYLLARLWVRVLFIASETSLFQGRLAHAGYIASAPVRLPEPAIVEQIVGLSKSQIADPKSPVAAP